MHRSHCYNPFVYLRNDNDVQRLVTNLFKATTPKGSQSQDPFWDTAASMLLLALVFYLKYEAPPDEQNFPMVMELLRAGEVREDDDSYVSPLDELFDRLEMINPEHIALKYYRDYHSGSAKTLKSIQITLAARLTLWKRVRKYGAYCTGITQNVDDLLQSHTARTMLANSEFIIMLPQLRQFSQRLLPARFRAHSGCKCGSRKKPPHLTGIRRQPYK